MPTLPDLTTYTTAELETLRAATLAEISRRNIIANGQADQQQAADAYANAVKNEAPLTAVPTGGIGPGRKVTEAGKTYINTSGAWLPVMPSAYPLGYRLETPPVTATDWKAGETVKAGDLRKYNGVVYKAIQGHATQAGWEPPNVAALWAVA